MTDERLRFSVKDVFDIQGHQTSLGIKPPPFPPAQSTAAVIIELLKAGHELAAIVSLDPLGLSMSGKNPYYGDVENPTYPGLPCLGSSCGSAASVITGKLDFSLGTDSGGSVRAPAASVGLWSFKATSEFFPREGVQLFHPTMDTIGVIARDLKTLSRVASVFVKDEMKEEIDTLVVPEGSVMKLCSKNIREAFSRKLDLLSRSYRIHEILTGDFFEEAIEIRKPLLIARMRKILQEIKIESSDLRALAQYAQSLTKRTIEDAQQLHATYTERWVRIFPRGSALFMPTLPNETLVDNSPIPLNYFLVSTNILDLPAVSFPEGSGAFPCSMQIVGTNRRNFSVLQNAHALAAKM